MAIESSVKKNIDLTQIEQICKEHQGRKGDLLIVLQKIQALCGYVPQAVLPVVTQRLGATPSEIYGVDFLQPLPFVTPGQAHNPRLPGNGLPF
jgi:NADH:ubiquinone oxidoreductase subunit E